MSSIDTSTLAERLSRLLDEVADTCGRRFQLVTGSVILEDGYAAATALSRADCVRSSPVRHDILAKIFIAEGDEHPQEWVLLFHYLNGRLVSPAGLHHMRLTRTDARGIVEWTDMGWETDEYEEWSELDKLAPEELEQ